VRICLASIHPRLLSGQIDSLVGLARLLRERGHEVSIVSAFADVDLLDADRAFGAAAEAGHLVPRMTRLLNIGQALDREGRRSDLIHLNLPTPSFGVVANILQARLGRPVVVGFEAHLPTLLDIYRQAYVSAAPRFYLPHLLINNRLLARLGGFGAAHYVVASQYQLDELVGLGAPADRVSAIPNLFDPARLTSVGGRSPMAERSGREGARIGYVGHFNHVKGVDLLVRALPAIRRSHPHARLALAWSGLGDAGLVRRAIAEAGVSEQVELVGRVSVDAFLAECDVCVLPYRLTMGQAAFPGLVLEAMAVGVPLVTTDLPLLRELLQGDGLALLAQPENPTDLARHITRLLDDPAGAGRMVARQRRAIATRLSPTILVRRYEELYERVLSPEPAGQAGVLPTVERGEPVRSAALR
jgi:glycosyltransferase involved in cell wall biosynthesis